MLTAILQIFNKYYNNILMCSCSAALTLCVLYYCLNLLSCGFFFYISLIVCSILYIKNLCSCGSIKKIMTFFKKHLPPSQMIQKPLPYLLIKRKNDLSNEVVKVHITFNEYVLQKYNVHFRIYSGRYRENNGL